MPSRISRLLVTLMLCVSIGLHWGLLQTVAWVSMLADFTGKTGSIVEAASMTFDGDHACPLCRAIAEAKAKEEGRSKQGGEDQKSVKKDAGKLLLLDNDSFAFRAPAEVPESIPGSLSLFCAGWGTAPPLPPPRVA